VIHLGKAFNIGIYRIQTREKKGELPTDCPTLTIYVAKVMKSEDSLKITNEPDGK